MKSSRFICFLPFFILFLNAYAQDGSEKALGKYLRLSVSKDNGQYEKGENIKVFAEVKKQGYGNLRMDILVNGIKKESRGLNLKEGVQCILDTCYHDTRAVIVSLCSEEMEPRNLDIGFVVAPEGFRPGFKAPKDLKKYWNGEIEAWRKVKSDIILSAVRLKDSDENNFKCWSVEISCPEGRPVRGYLAMPADSKPGSLPIIIKTCAAGVSGHWCKATPEKTVECAKYGDGCLAFMLNAHGLPNDAPDEYYKELENGELYHYSTRHITSREDYYFRTMFLRLERALDYLCSLPEWDGKRVLTYGESQGGAQAAALAGLDRRVTAAVLNVPGMMDTGGILVGRRSCWPQVIEKEPDNPDVLKVAPYFDTALLLKYSKAEIFCDIGLIDTTCPAAAVFSGLNNAGGKVHVVTYPRRPHHEPYDKEIHADFEKMILAERNKFLNSYLSK